MFAKPTHRFKPASVFLGTLVLSLTGCPAPTPGERMQQLGAKVTDRGDGIVDLDLSGTGATNADIHYVHGFTSNSKARRGIHTLDLSGLAITDEAIDFIVLQNPFCPPDGVSVFVLKETDISHGAIEKLRETYPDAKIEY